MLIRRPLIAAVLLVAATVLAATGPAGAYGRAAFPALSMGTRGVDVVALQHLLRARGYAVVPDGIFSGPTQSAVAAFQRQQSLAVNGVADAGTWERLVPPMAAGANGESVLAVQKLLNRKRGAALALNATYDAATRAAVGAFQNHAGIGVSGDMNTPTWRNLLWHYARPAFSPSGLCNYNGGNAGADWGTGSVVGMLESAAARFNAGTGTEIAVGDISWEHGQPIVLHATHEAGLDVDIALVRKDRRQCNRPGIGYGSSQYDRAATRLLIQAIYEAAPNQVKLIYFNDPVLVSEGLVQRYPNHADHIHVRYCEVGHAQTRYRCAAPSLDDGAMEEPVLVPAAPPTEIPPDWTRPIRLAMTPGVTVL